MHILKLSKSDLGFDNKKLFFTQIKHGAWLGFLTLFPVFILLYMLNVHIIDQTRAWTLPWFGKKLLLESLLALLISLVEEPVFRGLLLTGLSKKFSPTWAIFISSLYYAGLHFVNSDTEIPSQDVHPFSGLQLFNEAIVQLYNPDYVSPFFSLLVVGIFLGMIKAKLPAGIGICIGCHACWVWQIKLSKLFFNVNIKSPFYPLVSTYDGVIGSLVTVWLFSAILIYVGYNRYRIKKAF
jgi:membrane protease YdiL (CAAX protease family)